MGGFSSGRAAGPITGINVTPLVDITLVLLIIFMVTAKLVMSHAVPMNLPKAATGGQVQEVFSVDLPAEGPLQVDGTPIAGDTALLHLARAAGARNAELRAVVRADGSVPHARVMHTVDVLRQAEVSRIAFAVSPGSIVEGGPGEEDASNTRGASP
ncbi:MAG: biopolymer transporter ExbD [Myxococcales bacterium]|nr:biopolymer transporter ExbD [Myxococcales bacterium]